MTSPAIQLLTLLLATTLAVGCERDDVPTTINKPGVTSDVARDPASASTTQPVPRGNGTIQGRVTLTGFSHTPKPYSFACTNHKHVTIPDERVVTGPNNALANVVVYLKDAPSPGDAGLPPAVLDQVDCRYVPHVVTLQVGQTLTVKSRDATLHNVHAFSELNKPFNFGMNGKANRDVRFTHPETLRVKCDVHPWMYAYVSVFAHPYFAVTGPDGSFRLTGLPKGTYTLAAWHEMFDTLEQQITIDESTPEVTFAYQPPAN